jgi:hypothetical protein
MLSCGALRVGERNQTPSLSHLFAPSSHHNPWGAQDDDGWGCASASEGPPASRRGILYVVSRFAWILVSLAIAAGLASVYIGRGANQELRAYLGMWNGGLTVGTNTMKGYLRLKGSRRQFEMHLEGRQQEIDLAGIWTLDNLKRISLKVESMKINDFGGEEKRDPNKPYLPNSAVNTAYAQPLQLDLSSDGESLTSLPVRFGELTGIHSFQKGFGKVR